MVALLEDDDGEPPKPGDWHRSGQPQPPARPRSGAPARQGRRRRASSASPADAVAWAVLDSGIDATHPAFSPRRRRAGRAAGGSRVRRSPPGRRPRNLQTRGWRAAAPLGKAPSNEQSAIWSCPTMPAGGRLIGSSSALPIEITAESLPHDDHGTHVAGILRAPAPEGRQEGPDHADPGMCPDIQLYDFRVLAPDIRETEFAIIAALQYIRYINERHRYMTIHGANLSLSIPHDVRNFACGRTPVCNECERLVDSGVVVVAAAGNRGYHSFETKDGSYEGYAASASPIPGNADGVITVGATHRFWPHTYGVSFFSSRGPTGDGRIKPDLVAPGERIRAPLPHGGWGDLDGTSMAAPHVSGAAAMLMARYSELIGQPRRIKQILCDSATDLGRERASRATACWTCCGRSRASEGDRP